MKISRILLALALSVGSLLVSPSAALAHDEVVSTTPSQNSTVSAGKVVVSVTFSEDVMQMDGNPGIEIRVTYPNGGGGPSCLSVDGATISTNLDLDQAGLYKVDWQSVSNDGHANTGSFTFDVTNTSGYKSQEAPPCANLLIAPNPNSSASDSTSNQDMSQTQFPWFATIIFLLAAAGIVVLVRRRRADKK